MSEIGSHQLDTLWSTYKIQLQQQSEIPILEVQDTFLLDQKSEYTQYIIHITMTLPLPVQIWNEKMKNIQVAVFEHPCAPVFVMPPFTYLQGKNWNMVF